MHPRAAGHRCESSHPKLFEARPPPRPRPARTSPPSAAQEGTPQALLRANDALLSKEGAASGQPLPVPPTPPPGGTGAAAGAAGAGLGGAAGPLSAGGALGALAGIPRMHPALAAALDLVESRGGLDAAYFKVLGRGWLRAVCLRAVCLRAVCLWAVCLFVCRPAGWLACWLQLAMVAAAGWFVLSLVALALLLAPPCLAQVAPERGPLPPSLAGLHAPPTCPAHPPAPSLAARAPRASSSSVCSARWRRPRRAPRRRTR